MSDPRTIWYCTACGNAAHPREPYTLIDQAGRYARGRHCGGMRDLVTDPEAAQRGAAIHRARAAERAAERDAQAPRS